MLWVYCHFNLFNSFSAGTIFRRKNPTSDSDVRLKTVPVPKGVKQSLWLHLLRIFHIFKYALGFSVFIYVSLPNLFFQSKIFTFTQKLIVFDSSMVVVKYTFSAISFSWPFNSFMSVSLSKCYITQLSNTLNFG